MSIVTEHTDGTYYLYGMTEKGLVWVSRTLRWGLGSVFIAVGIAFAKEGGWPALLFGAVMIITGFFKPRRCIADDQCNR